MFNHAKECSKMNSVLESPGRDGACRVSVGDSRELRASQAETRCAAGLSKVAELVQLPRSERSIARTSLSLANIRVRYRSFSRMTLISIDTVIPSRVVCAKGSAFLPATNSRSPSRSSISESQAACCRLGDD